mmetsp:Transcript_66244/g.142989  ORF Transcript_66244/g.142989 Transcript_66244/m.142989 type:complete len:169 (-) Transcript_66244:458-964(-)|eukprot:CAMPEP_0116896434 /NCGR_PEP_ID=MMETSP0467-20121206/5680_1 /TAXON_ID=283647 /ORGANISM="Mesodinium pulex, Strain SPMC105" /LENGTH=168 /DNA_ID=CAMNT_0004567605 /DNA_START=1642 /DNA_END=2148 /DNA_ORIENTATION=-
MNDTSKVAKELVEQVKVLQPEVMEKKKNAEIKSKTAEEEEGKANVVLDSQKETKELVEGKVREAREFLDNTEKQLKEANKFKNSAVAAVERLKDDQVREVAAYKAENMAKMAGVEPVLKAVCMIVTGKGNLSDLKKTLVPKNLKGFDLNLIETEFEKYKKICDNFKKT